MKELLEAGVHFGHQVRKWNPKMRPYIYTARDGVHVLDLAQTVTKLGEAFEFVKELGQSNKTIIFIGTKKQAAGIIEEEARRCEAMWVSHRWIGGTLTNWDQVQKNIKKLADLKSKLASGYYTDRTKKELLLMQREVNRLEMMYGGLEKLNRLPDAVFVVDCQKEDNAVREAKKMGVPIVAICDTNCDPEALDFPIPGNDDAVKAIRLITKAMADAYLEGRQLGEKQAKVAESKRVEEPELVVEKSGEPVKAKKTSGKTAKAVKAKVIKPKTSKKTVKKKVK